MVTDTDADTKMLMRPVFFYLPSTFIWGDDHKTLGPCIVDWTKTKAWARKGGSKQSKGDGGVGLVASLPSEWRVKNAKWL